MKKHLLSSWVCCFMSLVAFAQENAEVAATMDSLNQIYQQLRPTSFREARGVFLKALEIAKEKDQKQLKAKLLHRLAFIEAGEFRFISTYNRYQEMLVACAEIQDSICMGRAYSRIGHIHMLRNEYPESLENGLKGIEILNSYEKEDPEAISGSLDEMVFLYWRVEDYEKARAASERSLNIRLRNNLDSNLVAKSARMLGDTYRRMNDLPNAKRYLNLAIDYSELVNHLIHSSLAKVAEQEGNSRATLYHHEQALNYLEEKVGARRRPIPYINQLKNVGDAHFQLREYPKAIRYYSKALDFAKEEQLEYETAGKISLAMAKTYQTLGKPEKALQYYQIGNLYLDSLREATAQERLSELEIKFRTQENKRQIDYLNQLSEQRTRERNWLLAGIVLFLMLSGSIISINRERKKIIDQLAAKNLETQQLYEELKTAQAQLVQSEKMISLGQLTAGIAHEINNPINFIASNIAALKLDFEDLQPLLKKAKQLEREEFEEIDILGLSALSKEIEVSFISQELDEIISSIERGIRRTKDIISSLRAFSRNTPDKFELADLHLALDSVLVILGHQLKEKEIIVEKKFGKIPLISCNIGLLNQVFSNIIANAIQAVENNEQNYISISTQLINKQVVIKIKDNGSGMKEEVLQRVFEPFYTTKEVGKGTGLGLSISYNIVQQHEGDIQVESQVGEGTIFSILLPLERSAQT